MTFNLPRYWKHPYTIGQGRIRIPRATGSPETKRTQALICPLPPAALSVQMGRQWSGYSHPSCSSWWKTTMKYLSQSNVLCSYACKKNWLGCFEMSSWNRQQRGTEQVDFKHKDTTCCIPRSDISKGRTKLYCNQVASFSVAVRLAIWKHVLLNKRKLAFAQS